MVFAWNDSDPENDEAETGPMYHGAAYRGAAPLNLLSGVTNPQVETGQGSTQSFTLTVENGNNSVGVALSTSGIFFSIV